MGLGDLSSGAQITIGVCVGVISTSIQSLGLTLQRKSHLLEDDRPHVNKRPPHRRRRWQVPTLRCIYSYASPPPWRTAWLLMIPDRNSSVHSFQHPRLVDPDHHSPTRHPLPPPGVRPRFQLHLRDPNSLGTLHTALAHRDTARMYWRHANRRVRCYEGAGAHSRRAVGSIGETHIFAVDGGDGVCGYRDTGGGEGKLDLATTVEAYCEG